MLPEIAALRFGLGARPGELGDVSRDPRAWLRAQVSGPVALESAVTLAPSAQILAAFLRARAQRKQAKEDADTAPPPATEPKDIYLEHYRAQALARAQSAALTRRPFAERLVHFWSNHFAVSADKGLVTGIAGALENEAIRPHACGYFADLLLAVERHPAMIGFLDNHESVGPNSQAARFLERRDPSRRRGINENLAREILELHTLGVDGGYTQADVSSFARVLTGWSIGMARDVAKDAMRDAARGAMPRVALDTPRTAAGGAMRATPRDAQTAAAGDAILAADRGEDGAGHFMFRDRVHEPGSQVLLGRRFSEDGMAQGEAVLRMLAQHPSTARFLATKLARHFIADDPPAAAVERLAHAYRRSEGYLPSVYEALVNEELAWQWPAIKYKTPQDLVYSTLRALQITPRKPQEVLRSFEFLGQRPFTPGSPAGWPDTARSWDGSDALLHRVLWATRVSERFEQGRDPLALCRETLGRCARPETLTAVARAASGSQALALLILSPEFQRR